MALAMSIVGEQVLLRIYLDSADRTPRTPSFDRILRAARRRGLAGCTVLTGIAGQVHGQRVAPSSAWSIVSHQPVILEIVDAPDRIVRFLQTDLLQLLPESGLMTLERAAVMLYRHGGGSPSDPAATRPLPPLPGGVEPLSTLPIIEQRDDMIIDDTGVLLRIFIGESDRTEANVPLYQAIVEKAREFGLAGATVLRGSQGFGAHSVVHKAQLLEMSADLPIVIEIVDTEARISQLLPHLDQLVTEGMITMENVRIIARRAGQPM